MRTNSPGMRTMTIQPGTATTGIITTMPTTGRSLKGGMAGILTAVALTGDVFSTRITVADMAAADMIIAAMRIADMGDMRDMPLAVVVSKTMEAADIAVARSVV